MMFTKHEQLHLNINTFMSSYMYQFNDLYCIKYQSLIIINNENT